MSKAASAARTAASSATRTRKPAAGRKRHRIAGALAGIFGLTSLLCTLCRALPSELQALPYVPIIVSATPWFALLAAIALILAFISRRWFIALTAVLAIGLQAWWQYPFFAAHNTLPDEAIAATGGASANTGDSYARVMTCNVYRGAADAQSIVDAVRDERVEVLALQETSDEFIDALNAAGIGDYLPYAQVSSSDGVYGNGIWSATPLADPSDDDVNSSASFMPGGTVAFEGGAKPVRFVSVHTTAPVPGYWDQWKRSLDELALMRSDTSARYVFMGDFNATDDHTPFRMFLGDRFQDAAKVSAHGFAFTWPADRVWLPAFAGIDHVVIDRDMQAGQVKALDIPGSDHKALLATIAV